jgi:hypothetical protein
MPVETGDAGLTKLDGIESKRAVVDELGRALEVIQRHSMTAAGHPRQPSPHPPSSTKQPPR